MDRVSHLLFKLDGTNTKGSLPFPCVVRLLNAGCGGWQAFVVLDRPCREYPLGRFHMSDVQLQIQV